MPLIASQNREDAANSPLRFFETAGPFLARLDEYFAAMRSDFEPELRELVDYALGHSGKRLRPIALFLTGTDAEGGFKEEMVLAAAVVELVHLATLVHDDILDGAELRHDSPTVSRKHGVTSAVLLGDALFAQSLQVASRFPTTEVCRLVSEATRKVCAGEVEQSMEPGEDQHGLERYFRIIERKTAVLFEVACRLGAILGHPGGESVEEAAALGRHLGIAYQIYDDLLDVLGSEQSTGKTLGTDFFSGKGTLPLLLLHEEMKSEGNPDPLAVFGKGLNGARHDLQRLMRERGVVERVRGYFREELDRARVGATQFAARTGNELPLELADYVESRFSGV